MGDESEFQALAFVKCVCAYCLDGGRDRDAGEGRAVSKSHCADLRDGFRISIFLKILQGLCHLRNIAADDGRIVVSRQQPVFLGIGIKGFADIILVG